MMRTAMHRILTRVLICLAVALPFAVGQAAPPPAATAMAQVTTAEYRGDRPNDEPWLIVITDGSGWARVGLAAGHGGIMFQTVDGRGYLVVDYGSETTSRLGRQEEMLELMAADEGDWRRLALGLGRQQIEIAPRGDETIAGVAGQVYAITLIEDGRRSAPYEVVISADPRLAATGRELLRVYDLIRAPLVGLHGREPQPYTAFRTLLARGTPIRIGPHYRLRELRTQEGPAGSLVVQGTVLDRPAFVAVLREQLLRAPGPDRAAHFPPESDGNMLNLIATEGPMVNDSIDTYAGNDAYFENEAYADNASNPD
jgi:hypothetical protein